MRDWYAGAAAREGAPAAPAAPTWLRVGRLLLRAMSAAYDGASPPLDDRPAALMVGRAKQRCETAASVPAEPYRSERPGKGGAPSAQMLLLLLALDLPNPTALLPPA